MANQASQIVIGLSKHAYLMPIRDFTLPGSCALVGFHTALALESMKHLLSESTHYRGLNLLQEAQQQWQLFRRGNATIENSCDYSFLSPELIDRLDKEVGSLDPGDGNLADRVSHIQGIIETNLGSL